MLESGLPWGMVLYGEEEEQMMASSPVGSDIRTIWDQKIIKPYSPTVAEVDSVLAGELIFIDWKSGLEPAIFSKYSTPSGDPLVHLSSRPVFMPNYPGWGFHRFNPWRERFDVVIQNVLQAGLVDHWKQKTWIRMKEEQSTGDKDPGERDPMAPLGMDDLQVGRKFEPGNLLAWVPEILNG